MSQSHELDRTFPLRVEQVVRMGLADTPRAGRKAMQADVDKALDEVGLGKHAQDPIFKLSGGQFQRMLFARVLLQKAPIILLDEPFANVDEGTHDILMNLLVRLAQEGKMIFIAHHRPDTVLKYCSHTLFLGRHKHCWGLSKDVLKHHIQSD